MSKKKNNEIQANEISETLPESTKIQSEEITVVSSQDINFRTIKFKKDVPINFTILAFDELNKSIPNLDNFIKNQVIKIV